MTRRDQQHPNQYIPSVWARFSIALLHMASRFALTLFEKRTEDAGSVNTDTLLNIIELNKQTRFGKQHRFDTISVVGDPIPNYKKSIRLSRFTDYSQYIDDISAGQTNVLTKDRVDILAGSSGTTANSKRLPNTRRARRKFMFFVTLVQQGVISRAFSVARPAQRGINLMSSHTPPEQSGVKQPVTSANNAGMKSFRKQIPILWSSPATVFEIGHQPTAYYLHALFGLVDRRITYIAAIFAPHLTTFFSVIDRNQAQIISDIKTGTVAPDLRLSSGERRAVESRLRPDPVRAMELKSEFDKGFQGIAPRIWPDMRYIATVTTGSFSIYLPRLKQLTDDRIPIYSPCHASSEGMIGINLSPDRDDYVLTLGSAFFEFIPLAHADEDQPETVDVDKLEAGREYEVVLTNFAGLYRYRLDDIIRIMGFHGRAPIFKFLYRRGAILNLVGEKITEYHTAKALTASVNQWLGPKGILKDYTVASEICDGLSCYAFFAELDSGARPRLNDASNVAMILDRELCKANYYYWSNGRNADQLGPVKLYLVKPGTFDLLARMQDKRAGGAVSNQIKIPRVVREPEQIALLEKAVFFSSSGANKAAWAQTPVP